MFNSCATLVASNRLNSVSGINPTSNIVWDTRIARGGGGSGAGHARRLFNLYVHFTLFKNYTWSVRIVKMGIKKLTSPA